MPKPKSTYYTKTDTERSRSDRKSAVKVLLAILALLLAWFLIWLYDWKDELLGLFKKKTNTAPKITGGSTTTTNNGGDKIYFNTIVKEVETGGDVRYIYRQESAALIWYVQHNIGVQPNVRLTTLSGEQIYGDIRDNVEQRINEVLGTPYYVVNTTVIEFSEPQSGFAIFT
jgi:hypothetical protein